MEYQPIAVAMQLAQLEYAKNLMQQRLLQIQLECLTDTNNYDAVPQTPAAQTIPYSVVVLDEDEYRRFGQYRSDPTAPKRQPVHSRRRPNRQSSTIVNYEGEPMKRRDLIAMNKPPVSFYLRIGRSGTSLQPSWRDQPRWRADWFYHDPTNNVYYSWDEPSKPHPCFGLLA